MTAVFVLELVVLATIVATTVRRAARDRAHGPLGALTTVLGALAAWATAVALSRVVPRGGAAPAAFAPVDLLPLAVMIAVALREVAATRALPPRPPVAHGHGRRDAAGPLLSGTLATAILAALVVFVVRTMRDPDGDWDAFAFWNYRARMLVRAPGDPSTIFAAPTAASHPDYPLFLSGLVTAGWRAFDASPWWPAAVSLAGGAAAVAVAWMGTARRAGRAAAAVAALLVLGAPYVLRVAAWQYADLWVGASAGAALAWLGVAGDADDPGRARALRLAGACAAISAWTKNEGLLHVVAIGGALLVAPPPGIRRAGAVGRFLGGAAPLLAVVLLFKGTLAPDNDLVEGAVAGRGLAPLLDATRWGTVLAWIPGELARTARWNALPILVAFALLVPRRLVRPRAARPATARPATPRAALAAILGGYVVVYVLTPHPLTWHLSSSFSRLVLHLWPAACSLVAMRLAPWLVAGARDDAAADPPRAVA